MAKKRSTEEIQGDINGYKILLGNTDYQAIKHSEGELTDEEYAEMKQRRQSWRDAINELEEELAEADSDTGAE